ncbi:uncharacterized protein LOC130614642 [Hydractinia symbiolongicarpus]|uniref:uncharacterized protein LOC130614642 n=1 Tax=Hydractinia symbiolongicarpus TaxID=13093 RepID=UPI00254DD6A9|nr:uncharacterized protein LOC130614642 [Hydractinia symbiolongicarpus]
MHCMKTLHQIFLLLFLLANVKLGNSLGTLGIKLIKYENPTHTTDDGACCLKGGASTCRYKCLNALNLCVSSIKHTCDIGNKTMPDIQDGDKYRDDDVSKFISFRFIKWKNIFHLQGLFHVDTNFLVTNITKTFNIPATTFKHKQWSQFSFPPIIFGDEKTMTIKVSASCDQDYLLPDCLIEQCVPRDNNGGHYTCVNNTKICLQGWKDPLSNCLQSNKTSSVISLSSIHPTQVLSYIVTQKLSLMTTRSARVLLITSSFLSYSTAVSIKNTPTAPTSAITELTSIAMAPMSVITALTSFATASTSSTTSLKSTATLPTLITTPPTTTTKQKKAMSEKDKNDERELQYILSSCAGVLFAMALLFATVARMRWNRKHTRVHSFRNSDHEMESTIDSGIVAS